MTELNSDCPDCEATIAGTDVTDLPLGEHGHACPDCGRDVWCPCCGDLT